MKQYYEAHVTMEGDPKLIRPLVEALSWKFSCIDGDINLGDGVKCYATRQFNATKNSPEGMVAILNAVADTLATNVKVLRRKVELVIYDDRSSTVRCDGACYECHVDAEPEEGVVS